MIDSLSAWTRGLRVCDRYVRLRSHYVDQRNTPVHRELYIIECFEGESPRRGAGVGGAEGFLRENFTEKFLVDFGRAVDGEGLDDLAGDATGVVVGGVRAAGHHAPIGLRVVGLVLIDVIDHFVGGESPTEFALGQAAVGIGRTIAHSVS